MRCWSNVLSEKWQSPGDQPKWIVNLGYISYHHCLSIFSLSLHSFPPPSFLLPNPSPIQLSISAHYFNWPKSLSGSDSFTTAAWARWFASWTLRLTPLHKTVRWTTQMSGPFEENCVLNERKNWRCLNWLSEAAENINWDNFKRFIVNASCFGIVVC